MNATLEPVLMTNGCGFEAGMFGGPTRKLNEAAHELAFCWSRFWR